jgi:hypothetical protein
LALTFIGCEPLLVILEGEALQGTELPNEGRNEGEIRFKMRGRRIILKRGRNLRGQALPKMKSKFERKMVLKFCGKKERKVIIMQFIQAKRLNNKLGVRDNQPYIIKEVVFTKGGFRLLLIDIKNKETVLGYNSLDWFRKDFDIVDSIGEIKEYRELKNE